MYGQLELSIIEKSFKVNLELKGQRGEHSVQPFADLMKPEVGGYSVIVIPDVFGEEQLQEVAGRTGQVLLAETVWREDLGSLPRKEFSCCCKTEPMAKGHFTLNLQEAFHHKVEPGPCGAVGH